MIGQRLGHYRIVEKIGAGGMGEVYRAHDEQLHRDVALKVLPAGSFSDPAARARLLREARSAAALNHPHICTIHEVGEAEGQAYFAMELVEGRPLSELLAQGPLPVEQALRYGQRIADALAHAHERGIIHRDLKSANVVITPEGRAKVLDFGLAKRISGEDLAEATTQSQASLTQPGALIGTLPYMAPEQLRGQPADARSDLWALGVVLYEMAVGQRPFQGQTGFELSSAILNQPPPPLPGKVPVALRAVIERCLEKEPGRRYQRGGEVRAALETVATGAVAPWARLKYVLRRRQALALIVAVVLVLAGALGLNVGGMREKLFGAAAPKIESIAVLPLTNLSGDPEQDYFADGMTETLTTDLARLGGLKRVTARGSVMRYKGTNKPFAEIAGELKVNALVTGSVLRSGGRVSITAQLIDPATENQLWTNRYERDLADVLALQNEIVSAIVRELRIKVTPGEEARLASARAVNPEAYEAYLKGRFHWQKLSRQEIDTAEKYFQLALEKDPNYAQPYLGIGVLWGVRCNLGMARCSEALPKWKEAVRKAAELDPALPEVQAQLAGIKFYADWDWPEAERMLQRAIELNPSDAVLRVWYGVFLVYVAGRTEEGVAETRRALELDPHNSTHQAWVGLALVGVRRYDEAIAYLQQVLRADPNAPLARGLLRLAFERKQMYEEAMTVWRQDVAAGGDKEVAEAIERGYAQGGYRGAMRLHAELLVRRSQRTYVPLTRVAGSYAAAGEKELAMDWLEKAYQEHEMQMVRIKGNPRWDILRDAPRFQALLRRMNLPQ